MQYFQQLVLAVKSSSDYVRIGFLVYKFGTSMEVDPMVQDRCFSQMTERILIKKSYIQNFANNSDPAVLISVIGDYVIGYKMVSINKNTQFIKLLESNFKQPKKAKKTTVTTFVSRVSGDSSAAPGYGLLSKFAGKCCNLIYLY